MIIRPPVHQTVRQKVVIDILTDNQYLEKGLSRIVAEYDDRLIYVISNKSCSAAILNSEALRVCLVDIDCLIPGKGRWRRLSERINLADVAVIVSLQAMRLHSVPHLSLNRPVDAVRQSLWKMLKWAADKQDMLLLSNEHLTSVLNNSQKEMFLLLPFSHSVQEISAALHVSNKTVYQTRSQIMKKLGVSDRLELYQVLSLSKFLHFHDLERPTTP